MKYIIAFFVLTVLIFVHELGHFLAAKFSGIKVKTFAIGFGKTLFKKKFNETEYKLNLVPLGGYVSLEGEQEEGPDSFLNQPYLKRFSVLIGGIVFNFLFAIVLFSFIVGFYGLPVNKILISEIEQNSYANNYLLTGDMIVSINDIDISKDNWLEIPNIIKKNDKETNIEVLRNSKKEKYLIPLTEIDNKKLLGIKYGMISVFSKENISLKDTFTLPFEETGKLLKMIKDSFSLLISGKVPVKEISGPIAIVKITSDFTEAGFAFVLYWTAILSINLGFMNALPLPALDGGHIVFLVIEKIVGKNRWNQKYVNVLNTVFLFALLAFMLFVSINDVKKFLT